MRQNEVYNSRAKLKLFLVILVVVSHVTSSSFFYGLPFLFQTQEVYAANPTFTQNYFRFYVDNDLIKPTDPWPVGSTDLGENTGITANDLPPASSETLRLRMSVLVGGSVLATTTQAFKLQYGVVSSTCAQVTNWNDTGGTASSTIWRGFNGTPADGASLSTNPPIVGDLLLSVSDRAGSYEEENPTVSNPFSVAVGEDVEYDWALQDNGATASTTYCFRMTKSGGTPLDTYSFYPSVITSGYRPKTQNWRWYSDATNETPTTAMAGENVAPSNVANSSTIKLRITSVETANVAGSNIKFKAQYSQSSTFSPASDLVEAGNCTGNSTWCYASGGGADNSGITTLVLTDSVASGTHNTSGVSTSTFNPIASTTTEFEFTIKHAGALVNTTYFFRLFDTTNNRAVPLNTGKSYPSLVTAGAAFTFTVSGLNSGIVTEGVTTNATTTATGINFGSLAASTTIISAQRLTMSTNAPHGYQVFVKGDSGLVSGNGASIVSVSGTNALPAAFSIPSGQQGAFGYHAGDDVLSGGSTRFATNDTYAQLESIMREVAFSSVPTSSSTSDMVFKVTITNLQAAGGYTTAISYVVVPTY